MLQSPRFERHGQCRNGVLGESTFQSFEEMVFLNMPFPFPWSKNIKNFGRERIWKKLCSYPLSPKFS